MLQLNVQQEEALKTMNTWFESNEKYMTLEGAAGTGKTTVVVEFLKYLKSEKQKRIVATGATNAVVVLLKENLSKHDIPCTTIHRFLGLKVQNNKDVSILKKEDDDICAFDLVVVDECSMIDTQLWNIIMSHSSTKTKWLFVGDPCQLSPVKCDLSDTFNVKTIVALNKVERQSSTNPMKSILHQLRDSIRDESFYIPQLASNVDEHKSGIIYFNKSQVEEWFNLTVRYFKSEKYKGVNSGRVITFKNSTESYFNRMIRNQVVGTDEEFIENERIILKTPHVEKGSVVLATNDTFTIEKIKPIKIEPHRIHWRLPEYSVDGYLLTGRCGYIETTIKVVSPSCISKFDTWKKQSVKKWKSEGERNVWPTWNSFIESVCDVSYPYATTVRRLQGTTIEVGFPILDDLTSCSGKHNKIRNLYAALTRASRLVVALQ